GDGRTAERVAENRHVVCRRCRATAERADQDRTHATAPVYHPVRDILGARMLSGRPLACFLALAAGCGPTSTGPRRPLASLPTPPAAGAQDVWATDPGAQTQSSRWFLTLAGEPVTLALDGDLA